ncbi:S-adenosyl-L-methionine-dependent methyltransferases superfamily protein isoform 1 [Theobroma cacao]|uniref:S-adenosyl-L-methionine-dependent methyltransferases superfamily protein isoform 1 n=1 Tax=Theobroma cacao TaxID=3641 RepID=A0A061FUP8_THECC|nr:S-adenosyl-L-methionine-dependent methyltransferases superfamily protein isoform 1 [Theobroma cacao]
MVVCRCKILNVPSSLGTLVKHLPLSKPKTSFPPPQTLSFNSQTSAAIRSSSSFETLTSRQKDQVRLYVDALLQWNQKMNLTAVKEVSEVMDRHIEDSLAIIPPIQNSYVSSCNDSFDNLRIVDVGTGAGLPGLVLAIACPGWAVTLVESVNKRCLFLEHVVNLTGLSNVQVVRERAECIAQLYFLMTVVIGQNLGQDIGFREKFDVAVARAVAEMRVLAEYCLPLVRVGGLFVAAKGHDPKEEVRNAERAIKLLGASILQLRSGDAKIWCLCQDFGGGLSRCGITQPTWTENCYHLLKKSPHSKKISTWSRYTDKSATLIIRVSVLLSALLCNASCTSKCKKCKGVHFPVKQLTWHRDMDNTVPQLGEGT